MLKILKIQDKSEQEQLCSTCGVPYVAHHMAYRIEVDEQTIGIATFFMGAKAGYLVQLCTIPGREDDNALFIAGRGVLDFMERCGAHEAFAIGSPCSDSLLREIGFTLEDDLWSMDISEFFTTHKH